MRAGAVTQKDAARVLGVHVNTVANMLRDGRLEPVVFGNFSGHQEPMRRVDAKSFERLRPGTGCRKWDRPGVAG